ncbi:MAG: phage holin family protein [Candidatus Nealsonbacteria bacterium]|nr:phage holin family protein [Candidatus Nealsonbacteria bacterium]
MKKLFLQIIVGILGIFLAKVFIPGVELIGGIQILIFSGVILGLINFFIKPILKIITFPLKILTFGFFSLILNIAIIWFVDFIVPGLKIIGFLPLLGTTFIIWALNLIFLKF